MQATVSLLLLLLFVSEEILLSRYRDSVISTDILHASKNTGWEHGKIQFRVRTFILMHMSVLYHPSIRPQNVLLIVYPFTHVGLLQMKQLINRWFFVFSLGSHNCALNYQKTVCSCCCTAHIQMQNIKRTMCDTAAATTIVINTLKWKADQFSMTMRQNERGGSGGGSSGNTMPVHRNHRPAKWDL